MVAVSVVRLRDATGLRTDGGSTAALAADDHPSAPPVDVDAEDSVCGGPELPVSEAYERRRRMLDFWLEAQGSKVALPMHEDTRCSAEYLAIDAEQTLLHVGSLATPMGTYRKASVRTGDVLCAELEGEWLVDFDMPQPPTDAQEEQWALEAAKLALCAQLERSHLAAPAAKLALCAQLEPAHVATPAPCALPPDEAANEAATVPALRKYWVQRYMLFSKYDDGIRLDQEGWFSVTPEVLAAHMAERCRCDLLIDAFAGVGGNAIQFAYTCERVIAVDLDATRLHLARHNASVYKVADRIEFVQADFMQLAAAMKADVVFLSPPWGGPGYKDAHTFDIDTMMGGLNGSEILHAALSIAPNVAYFLPKNTNLAQIEKLARDAGVRLHVDKCLLNNHVKGLMAYFGFDEEDELHGEV
ncbi:hypothetical protein AB1Y20_020167 [Prymnesium parvum]|uniref:Trimethylguanosine synthase n=1 Tax=Prymnesium parvum TaxID=97485 RepID=A0AB34JTW6_PRYPA